MKIIAFLTCIFVAIILFKASADFPDWGDPNSPANKNVSTYYLENSLSDTKIPNVVSSVLADYRSFDTMLETTVVLIAAIAIVFLIRKSSYDIDYKPTESGPSHHNLIIITICRLLIPIMQIFALYVVVHGHYSPGGGFQGGVVLGATLILHALAFGLRHTMHIFNEMKQRIFSYYGVMIFAGTGLVCILLGSNFLDYAAFANLVSIDKASARSLAILIVEAGVALTVMSVMFSIYADLSSAGDLDQGL